MNKGWTIFLVLAGGIGVAYLFYRSQKRKPLITIPALSPTVVTTPSWLETLKAVFSPPLTMPSPPLVAPTLTPEEKTLAEELGVSEYTVRKFKQVM